LLELFTQHPELPWFSFYLGSARWEQPAESERLYRIAAGRFAERGVAEGEFRARSYLHDRLTKRGHLEEAVLEEQRAIRVAEASGNTALLANARILEVNALVASGQDLGHASQLLAKAHRILFPHGSDRAQKDWLHASAEVSLQTGRRDEAQQSFRALADLASSTSDPYRMAAAQSGLLRVLLEKAAEQPSDFSREEVLKQAKEALAAAQAARDSNKEFRTQLILGLLAAGVEAREHFARCVNRSITPAERCYCLGGWARQLAEENPRQAQAVLGEALTVAKQSEDPWLSAFFSGDRMRVSWRTQSPSQAIADSWKALNDVEALRRAQGPASQAGLFSTWSDDYYWFSGSLLVRPAHSPDDIAKAFSVTERLRGRALIEKLADVRPEPPSGDVLNQQLQGVREAIQNVERRVDDASLPAYERKCAVKDRAALESKGVKIQRQLRSTDSGAPGSHEIFAGLQEVRSALGPDEALLSFQVAPWKDWTGAFGGGSWLTVVTQGGTRVYDLKTGREELRQLAEKFTRPIAADEEVPEETLVVLYQKLLVPALADLPRAIKRLVILPDDDLHRLPFAALHAAKAPPLVNRYQITVAPSATLWRRWRLHRPPRAAVPALVLADPADLGELPRLPRTAEEGKAAIDALGGNSVLLTRKDASEAFLKKADLSRYGLLVLATHSRVEDDPEFSSVRLTPGHGENGHLKAAEILTLKMDGKVVVLSTCESAGGQILRGEGVLSLARAFFEAGAHTVVGSLWPIDDEDGERLFERFYRYLGKGASVAAALRAAQRDRKKDGAPLKAWAGFVVLGDGDLVPLPGGRKGSPVMVWASALAAALLGLPLAWRAWRYVLCRCSSQVGLPSTLSKERTLQERRPHPGQRSGEP